MGANQHTSKGRKAGYRIMFTDAELTSLHARASAEGITLADLIRACLGLAEAPTARDRGPCPMSNATGAHSGAVISCPCGYKRKDGPLTVAWNGRK